MIQGILIFHFHHHLHYHGQWSQRFSLGWKQVIQVFTLWHCHCHLHYHFHKGFLWVGNRWFMESSSFSFSSPPSLPWSQRFSLDWKQVKQGILFDIVIAIFIIMVTKVSLGLRIGDSRNLHCHCQCYHHRHSWLYDASGLQLCYSTWANWSEVALPFSRLAWQSNQSEHDSNAYLDGNDDINGNDYFGQCWYQWQWW